MRQIALYITVLLILSGCQNNDSIFGVYEARYKEKGAIHYVELFPDSTFYHVYEKDNIKKEHKGCFQLYKYGGHYYISFDAWRDFDERSIEYKKRYHSWERRNDILINKGQIFFDLDLYELNFKKK